MEYTTKKCPHCNYTYTFREPKGTGHYGSPIRTCDKCNQYFVDKDYIEIAVDGIREVDKNRVSLRTIINSITFMFFAFGILYVFGIEAIIFSIVPFIISIGLIVRDCAGYKSRQNYLNMERINSENRLKNYEYAALLKEFGYDVPEKYLEEKE